jgi:glycosyltransferase involved in cell wall biosynthesis
MTNLRLLLVTDTVGGVWVYSVELARALEPLGIDTVLAVAGPPPSAEQRKAAGALRLIDTGLPLEWLDTRPQDIARAGEELARIADGERIDVIQTSSAALLAHARFDQPCVAVQHSCVATWWDAVKGTRLPKDFEWRRDLVARGLDAADAIVTPTRAFATATERAYGVTSVRAVHNGRTAAAANPLPKGDFAFAAGRLWDEGKNVTTLDHAAARIAAPFQAAGSTVGPNGASVALQHLTPVGELSGEKLAGVLAAKPIFASAALYEPFGLSVLEAAQAGCALVLSDIPTHRELWDGAALFAEPRADERFAGIISRLLTNPGERERLGRSARERASRYSPARMARQMADIYAQALKQQPQLVAGAA